MVLKVTFAVNTLVHEMTSISTKQSCRSILAQLACLDFAFTTAQYKTPSDCLIMQLASGRPQVFFKLYNLLLAKMGKARKSNLQQPPFGTHHCHPPHERQIQGTCVRLQAEQCMNEMRAVSSHSA
eukprot:4114424-Amphidinium_carterae.1